MGRMKNGKSPRSRRDTDDTRSEDTSVWLSHDEHDLLAHVMAYWNSRLGAQTRKTKSDVVRAALTALLAELQRHPHLLPLQPLPPHQSGRRKKASFKLVALHRKMASEIEKLAGARTFTSMIRDGLRILHSELLSQLPRPRPLPFPRGGVTSRLIETLKETPANLDMRLRSHAMLTKNGGDMKFSFAGLILESARVIMNIEGGVAVGLMSFAERLSFDVESYEEDDPEDSPLALAQLQLPPQPDRIENELAIARSRAPRRRRITALDVMIPATAREIWAAEHGEYAAKRLRLYPEDWGTSRDRITAERVLEYLLDVQKGRYDLPVA